jgi:hypothetical protein
MESVSTCRNAAARELSMPSAYRRRTTGSAVGNDGTAGAGRPAAGPDGACVFVEPLGAGRAGCCAAAGRAAAARVRASAGANAPAGARRRIT